MGRFRTRAVYDVSASGRGELFVNGRTLTLADVPGSITMIDDENVRRTAPITAWDAATAESLFHHHQIDVDHGWDSKL